MFTENGVQQAPGTSTLWKGAGACGEENYLIDTERCGAVAFGVINEDGRLVHGAIRLQTQDGGAITEIEHVIGREKDFAYNPKTVLGTSYLDWETILAPEERQSRAAMAAAATDYFAMFTAEPYVSVPFADRCDRRGNGAHTTPSQQVYHCIPVERTSEQRAPEEASHAISNIQNVGYDPDRSVGRGPARGPDNFPRHSGWRIARWRLRHRHAPCQFTAAAAGRRERRSR